MQLGDLDPSEFERLSALLDEALDCDEIEREAWLDALQARDPTVAAQLRELLASASAAREEGMLETREVIERRLAESDPQDSWVGRMLGPWRVVAPLGHGGMGTVWLAERADGLFTRRVALKLVHRMLHAGLLERFAREREILAGLDHPNIARLLDAGFTDDGQPYLALDYVEGEPLTAWCDARGISLRARIELFLQVVAAVQFAHANLVVHRDLKPANILVTAQGQVRLLDFGIAKLIGDGEPDESSLTQFAGRAYTPDYASPEQVTGRPVTTASDVYALGVVLCELLCGHRPYRLKQVTRGALEDAIVSGDPARPSQLVTDAAAAARRATRRRLEADLAGDLDTIIGKALRKSPHERYRTADALGQDLNRYLRGEPVLARPESVTYHLRKFVARNRWPVAGATAAALALAVGTGVSLWQASVARDHAQAARREATKARAVQDFLLDIFRANTVEQPDPERARQTTARELLDLGARRVDAALKDAPEARSEVLDTLANMYVQLGLPDEAAKQQRQRIELLKKTFGSNDPRVASALLSYAEAILESPQRAQTIAVLDETRAVLDAAGDFSSDARGQLLRLYAQAYSYTSPRQTRRYADEAVAFFRKHPPGTWTTIPLALQTAARPRMLLGDVVEGERLMQEAIVEIRRHDPGNSAFLIVPLVGIAYARASVGDFDSAERHYREALAVSLERNGPYHGETLQAEAKLGALLHATGRRAEGRRLLEDAAAKLRRPDGPPLPAYVVAVVSGVHGAALHAEGSFDAAEPLLDIDLDDARRHYPGSSPLANALRARAVLHLARGRFDEAESMLREAIAIREQIAAEAHPWTHNRFVLDLARVQVATGRHREALETLGRIASPPHLVPVALDADTVAAGIVAAEALLGAGRVDAAARHAAEALDRVQRSSLRERFPALEAEASLRLGQALLRSGAPREARAHLERALALREAEDVPTSPWIAEAQRVLSTCLAQLGERAQAAALAERAATIMRAHARLGPQFGASADDPRRSATR